MGGLLEGKVALVTGAGSGIGRASARALARAGARVVVSDRAVEPGEETVRLIAAAGGEAGFVAADVADAGQVRALVEQVVARHGRLDCAHNNAGVEGSGAPTHEADEADWRRIVEINLIGTFLCMRAEIAQMLKQGAGAIVNTASIAGLVASPASGGAYTASKHGVVGLTKVAALEYARSGLRINAVCPGVIDTPLIQRHVARRPELREALVAAEPVGRLGTPEEVAEAVVWLCSDAASFVTGTAMPVDGGYTAR